jgi:predicted O-methyltransferase YrrM
MWHSIIAYFKFLLKSSNQHGVHSPFVYDLVTKCFYDKAEYKRYSELKNYRQRLLENNNTINITDLGSGSKTNKSNKRQIAQIAKISGTTLKRAKLLYRLSSYFKFKNILELGTSLGIATQSMHLGNPNAKITSIEGCPNISEFTKHQLKNYENINIFTGDFNEHIPKLKTNSYDLIFFDGNHNKDATLNYFNSLLSSAHNDSVFVFDDIYWSKDMTEAWETIKKHPQVSITIDTYFWGFVFFRKEQAKEHFKIRV